MDKNCEQNLQQIVLGFQECQHAFTAIGDETRQLILLVLLKSYLTGIRVNEIAIKTHLTRPSVSHHLQILKTSGIISMRKEGTRNYYYISSEKTQWMNMKKLIDLINQSIAHNEFQDGRNV